MKPAPKTGWFFSFIFLLVTRSIRPGPEVIVSSPLKGYVYSNYMQIEYTENKKHKIKAWILNFILVFGLLWIPTPGSLKMPASLEKLDLYLTILFGIPLIFQALHIFKKTYIIFSDEGIEENISLSKIQKIPWSETEGIRFYKLFFQNYMLVDLKDPKRWFDDKNFFQKIKGRANFNRTRTPLHIPVGNLNATPLQIIEDLKEFMQKKMEQNTEQSE